MITLRFSTVPASATGFLIRRFTWSDWSHVDVCFDGGLLGAQMDGVKIRDLNYEPKAKTLFLSTGILTEDQEKLFRQFLLDQLGKPYDFGAIAGFAIHRDWRDRSKWFCSELTAAAFEAAGAPLLRADNVDRISPRDLTLSPYLRQDQNAPDFSGASQHSILVPAF